MKMRGLSVPAGLQHRDMGRMPGESTASGGADATRRAERTAGLDSGRSTSGSGSDAASCADARAESTRYGLADTTASRL
jgi:hypothetical protein